MNKRIRSLDIARVSAIPIRRPAAHLRESTGIQQVIGDRPKTPRLGSARYTRQGIPNLKKQEIFRVRKSVADLVEKELADHDRCTFYQRVFILTKNATMTESVDSSVTSILDKYMQSKTNINENGQLEEEQSEEQQIEEERESECAAEEEIEQKTEAESRISDPEVKALGESKLLQITKSDLKIAYKEKRFRELDFFDLFHKRVETIIKKCAYEQLSDDHLTGLLLCMGNSHTLLVLEGTEDSVAMFCEVLLNSCSDCLEATRVFLVEDRIEETYFNDFLYRRSVAMNINEKFPPSTANDPQLMGSQHWLIKERLRILCLTLSEELRPKVSILPESHRMTEQQIVATKEEVVEQKPPRKRQTKRHRRKSPKREEIQTTQTDDTVQEDEQYDTTKRATTISLRLDPDRLRSSIVIKPEEKRNTEAAIVPRASSLRKESLKNQSETIFEEQNIPTTDIEGKDEEKDDEPLNPFALNPSTYVRLLPEVQRIELVLASKRFYLDLDEFIRFSNEIPMQEDEDAMIWPTSFSYLPLNVFDRFPYDVNLTFGNYDANEAQNEETTSSDAEEK